MAKSGYLAPWPCRRDQEIIMRANNVVVSAGAGFRTMMHRDRRPKRQRR